MFEEEVLGLNREKWKVAFVLVRSRKNTRGSFEWSREVFLR